MNRSTLVSILVLCLLTDRAMAQTPAANAGCPLKHLSAMIDFSELRHIVNCGRFGIRKFTAPMRRKTDKQRGAMGTFHVRCKIENHVNRSKSVVVPRLLVDTGSDYTWIPSRFLEKIGAEREKKDLPFLMANGQSVTRSVGFAIIRVDKYFTIDEVVFAEEGDLPLLGARSLEGLNLTVDPKRKKLVAAGPLLAAPAE